jgi:hypothetical protein
VAKIKYLGTTTNQSYIYKEIRNRLNLEDACYNSIPEKNIFLSPL